MTNRLAGLLMFGTARSQTVQPLAPLGQLRPGSSPSTRPAQLRQAFFFMLAHQVNNGPEATLA
ncbi:hypothetical protein, partial [Methylobacterium oxalidis]|uniref:hypothetical protein n=1 Tax=Methylobacterium oxalidis TaxID=944322 RepID=UPI0033144F4A